MNVRTNQNEMANETCFDSSHDTNYVGAVVVIEARRNAENSTKRENERSMRAIFDRNWHKKRPTTHSSFSFFQFRKAI